MDRACSRRISADDTARDSPEMCLQTGEIHPQPGAPRPVAMDSRASHDTHRAARFTSLTAPPAPILVTHGPVVSMATVQGAAAMASDGAGAVVRAGSVVAPVLLGDGPGTSHHGPNPKIGHSSVIGEIISLKIVTGMLYWPRCQATGAGVSQNGTRISVPSGVLLQRLFGTVRGDRSLHRPPWSAKGARSGDRRAVSLSPVPASHIQRFAAAPDESCCRALLPSRIRRVPVAQRQP
jgi:hypothetical protein